MNPKIFFLFVTRFQVRGKKENPLATPSNDAATRDRNGSVYAGVTLSHALVKMLQKRGLCVLSIPKEATA